VIREPRKLFEDLGLIRFDGRVDYADFSSLSSSVVESLQAIGGVGVSIVRGLVAAADRPVAI
jgi:hypothetical protein